MQVVVIFMRYLDPGGQQQTVGGVETYIEQLGLLAAALGWQPVVVQCAARSFDLSVGPVRVIGVPCRLEQSTTAIGRTLYPAAIKRVLRPEDILIFGTDLLVVPTGNPRAIVIQHGISFDLPIRYISPRRWLRRWPFARLYRVFNAYRAVRAFENCRNHVCVDYNFYNWYRTLATSEELHRVWVIPNFTATLSQIGHRRDEATDGTVRLIFARRFVDYRGSRLMADALSQILSKQLPVEMTFAGEGPDEVYLRNRFGNDPRVRFIRYRPSEAVQIHCCADIAIVPSIASEGTTFSVAEAMAAGCAVVATHVGGITNMIIDGYNGLLIPPSAAALQTALERLINDGDLRRRLGQRAQQVAEASFGLERWRRQWTEVLTTVASEPS